jgi:hypothetical protein
MIAMNSLPNQAQTGSTPPPPAIPPKLQQHPGAAAGYGGGLGSKELEVGMTPLAPEAPHLTEIGKDFDLPKEVAAVGVRISQTQFPVPANLAAHGVQPAGSNVTVSTGTSVTLPLSDDQIARGLKQDVTTSWRWLAEWCVRHLKQLLAKGAVTAH